MSKYTDALRTLADLMEAYPEWEKRAVFNANHIGVSLTIHPQDERVGREVRHVLGGEWAADCTRDGGNHWLTAEDLCGFRKVTVFGVQS